LSVFQIESADEIDAAAASAIERGLDAFNEAQVGPDNCRTAWVVARDRTGRLIGGLKGISIWNWFLIDWVWVEDGSRGQGIGSALVGAAEDLARQRRCQSLYLNTFSFQAPEFYRKMGYVEFGRLENFPEGHTRFWLKKGLLPPIEADGLE
jgi:GNAT superfamily N-acetyltransferase